MSEAMPFFPSPWAPADPIVDPERQDNLLCLMQSEILRLEGSTFYRRFLLRLRNPRVQEYLDGALGGSSAFDMVIYGVGSFESSEKSRLQMALAVLLRWELNPKSAELFDPVLSGTECAVAAALGFTVATVNEHGRREVQAVPTLFYMPHCSVQLYDALMQTNWDGGLRRMVVLGNSFADYECDAVKRGCRGIQKFGTHVLRARSSGFVRELDIAAKKKPRTRTRTRRQQGEVVEDEDEDEDSAISDAFVLTSWHFFPC